MKAVIGVAVVVVIGVVLWLMMSGGDQGADQIATSVDAGAAAEPSDFLPLDPEPASGAGAHLTKEARVLEAIAHGMQQKPDAGDGDEEVLVSQPPTKEQRRAHKQHVKATSKQLVRVVRDCLRDAVKASPALSNPKNKVTITVAPGEAEAASVSEIVLVGPGGALEAPALQGCLRRRAEDARLQAPPIMPGSDQPIEYSFPLITPSGTQ